jgi:hypothetical protein
VGEVFGTERKELLSTSENEVLEPDQLAALEANEPLMADEIAAIEGCIASAGRRPRGSQKRYASVKLSDAPENIKEIYLAVFGDAFHGMQRPRVPVNHSVHKMLYVRCVKLSLCGARKQWQLLKLSYGKMA